MKISKSIYIEVMACLIITMQVIGRETLTLGNSLYYPTMFVGALLLFFLYAKFKITSQYFTCVLIYVILSFMNSVIIGTANFTSILFELTVYVPLGLFFAINSRYTKKLWYAMCIYIAYFVMQHWFASYDGYNLFYGMGRNYVSVYLIILVFILSVVLSASSQKLPFWVFVAAFVFSVMAVGRTGIMVTLLMLIGIVLYRTFEKNERPSLTRMLRIIAICLILIVVAVYVYLNFESILYTYFPRFAGKESSATLSNALRLQMFQDYINECLHSLEYLVLGIDPSRITTFSGNLHNSYFQVHSTTGIVWLGWIVYAIVRFVRKEIEEKNYELLIPTVCFLLRASMDWCFPGFLGSAIIWFVIFSSLKENKIKILKN